MLLSSAQHRPHELALDDFTRTRTWRELEERVHKLASFLRNELELRPGDHIATLMPNRVEYIELTLASLLTGVWLTPINWHLQTEEVQYIAENSGVKALFCDASLEATARTTHTPLVRIDDLDSTLFSVKPFVPDFDAPPGAMMIYTSGTTGRPKGVKRAQAPSIAKTLHGWRKTAAQLGLDGSGPHLITGPMYHAAPLLFAVYDLLCGAPILALPRWQEERALEILQTRQVHHTHFVPTQFVRMLKLADEMRSAFQAPSLHLVLHGAAPISPRTKQEMIAWWGPILVEYWGATEGGFCTLTTSEEWLANPGTVGKATENFEIFSVDAEKRKLPPGKIGDLYCRHKKLDRVFEYHDDPEKTARAYLAPGTYTIGDIGYVDQHGYVYLCDRRSNMIISGGVNIYPAEIERVLLEHSAIADVGVFGIPDEEWGESVKAVVALQPTWHALLDGDGSPEKLRALENEILTYARTRLAAYKLPRSIDFVRELPRTPMGKLNLQGYKEPYWRGHARKI